MVYFGSGPVRGAVYFGAGVFNAGHVSTLNFKLNMGIRIWV